MIWRLIEFFIIAILGASTFTFYLYLFDKRLIDKKYIRFIICYIPLFAIGSLIVCLLTHYLFQTYMRPFLDYQVFGK